MASVVWTTDEEPIIAVAKFIAETAWADGGEEVSGPAVAQTVSEATALLASNRLASLIRLLLTPMDAVMSKATDKDVESVFFALASLLQRLAAQQQQGAADKGSTGSSEAEVVASEIAAKLTATSDSKAAVRVKILLFLYNSLPSSPSSQLLFLSSALTLSLATHHCDVLLPSLRHLIPRLAGTPWATQADTTQLLALYRDMHACLKEAKSPRDASLLLSHYLSLLSSPSPSSPVNEEALDLAASAALDFIQSPTAFHSDLLSLPIVQQLQQSDKHEPLFRLLSLLLTARLSDLLAFLSSHPSLLASLAVSEDDCTAKMRLLTLADMASDALTATHPNPSDAPSSAPSSAVGEIRYAAIQDALQVPESDVEQWVVRAIASKIIDARMNQQRRSVTVLRSTPRTFSRPQWLELQTRLAQWKENVSTVVRAASLGAHKLPATATSAAATQATAAAAAAR